LLRATPDGQYLVGTDGTHLVRYRIDGTAILHEQTGPAVVANPAALCVSPDGKYACVPCAAGNTSLAALPVQPGATYVFEVAALRPPPPGLPEPKPGGGPLARHTRQVGDAAVTDLAVNAAGTRPCVAWDATGKAFYLLDLAGTVRRVALDGFREEASLETERSV